MKKDRGLFENGVMVKIEVLGRWVLGKRGMEKLKTSEKEMLLIFQQEA